MYSGGLLKEIQGERDSERRGWRGGGYEKYFISICENKIMKPFKNHFKKRGNG
jgi:hypothetical protein